MSSNIHHIASLTTPIFLSLIPVVLLNSCSDDTIVPNEGERLIRFDVKNFSEDTAFKTRGITSTEVLKLTGGERPLFLVPRVEEGVDLKKKASATRSEMTSAETIENFGVFAGYASEATSSDFLRNYMDNVEITRNSGWAPAEEFLWPGDGALHFNAYSPYSSSTSQESEGIKAVNNIGGSLSLDYKVPADVSKQQDLLFANSVEASSSPCSLTFNHALTGIRFVTGAEMAPCIIKSITLSGILSEGKLDLETGEWSNTSGSSSYSIAPGTSLKAAEGSSFVEPATPLAPDSLTFILLPQTLSDSAAISIVIESNGKETTLTSSLSGETFPEGKTITYRLSANPDADSLILDVTGDFNTIYTGSSFSFDVKSSRTENGTSTPVNWIAEFVDDDGNKIAQPTWVESMTLSGNGDTSGVGQTEMQDIIFDNMSPQTRTLQNAGDVNLSSGATPFNLSSATGEVEIENTANTYVINAPGKYSLPLVYGNGIKNGGINSGAYTSTRSANALKHFVNHLNAAITSPYIYENAGCEPMDAYLVWEDELNLIRKVSLSTDKKSLTFEVPQNTIRQGNAIVAVRDGDGKVMWSWQIWVTDYNLPTGSVTVPVSGSIYALSTANLGYVAGGDITRFPECSVKIRFTQTDLPDGIDPLSKTVTLTQSGTVIETPDCNTFYQWGRKDPMMSSVKQWYDANHNVIQVLPVLSADNINTSDLVMDFIQNPAVFFTANHGTSSSTKYPYNNLWNVNYSAANVKSIYDPSPVGYVVPYTQPLSSIISQTINYQSSSTSEKKKGFYVTLSGGETLFFPDFNYRAGSTGSHAEGAYANYWLSRAVNLINGGVIQFLAPTGTPSGHQITDPLFHGLSVRPVKEEN